LAQAQFFQFLTIFCPLAPSPPRWLPKIFSSFRTGGCCDLPAKKTTQRNGTLSRTWWQLATETSMALGSRRGSLLPLPSCFPSSPSPAPRRRTHQSTHNQTHEVQERIAQIEIKRASHPSFCVQLSLPSPNCLLFQKLLAPFLISISSNLPSLSDVFL
jgi:hypothetical protein